MTRLFIYGTLKRGCWNHHYLHGQRFIATAATEPKFRLFNLGSYPGMVRDQAGISIEGEIWEVDDDCLAQLDVLEDIDGGEYVKAFIALLPPHGDEPVRTYLYGRSVDACPFAGSCWQEM